MTPRRLLLHFHHLSLHQKHQFHLSSVLLSLQQHYLLQNSLRGSSRHSNQDLVTLHKDSDNKDHNNNNSFRLIRVLGNNLEEIIEVVVAINGLKAINNLEIKAKNLEEIIEVVVANNGLKAINNLEMKANNRNVKATGTVKNVQR
jgi:hypothetical protein